LRSISVSAIEIPGYKIVRTLGVGGQATVYLAIQTGFDREVALKVMSPVLAVDPTFGERFIREAKIVAKLSHKNIVTVYDVGESGNFYYLAMEYMPGGDLKSRIEKGMKARECLDTIASISLALHFAHEKGYIHRDVKSENILFNAANEPFLTDFGIAKASNSSTQMTQTGKLIGTPEYMSPEQCRGKTIDGRSDLYSLGIILYEMLNRKVPFTGEDSVSVCIKHVTQPLPKLPVRIKHFQWMIELLLAKKPEERFQNGLDLANAITEFKKTGQAVTKTISKTISTDSVSNKSKSNKSGEISQNSLDSDEIASEHQQDEDFDHLFAEKRESNQLAQTKKSSSGLTTLLVIGVVAAAGFFTQELWYQQAFQWYQVNLLNQQPSNPNLSNNKNELSTKQSQPNELANQNDLADLNQSSENNRSDSNVTESNEAGTAFNKSEQGQVNSQNIEQLLAEADSLLQFKPHKISDIKQALKLLSTVKHLAPDNNNADLIYNNILSTSLAEATQVAEKDQFESAQQWLQLVSYEQQNHPLLNSTEENIARLKLAYDDKQIKQKQLLQQVDTWLELGNQAIKNNQLSGNKEDNALYYYQQVLDAAPNNQQALDGLDNVNLKYQQLIETNIANNAYTKAKVLVGQFELLSEDKALISNYRLRIIAEQKKYQEKVKQQNRLAKIALEKKQAEQARSEKLADPMVQLRLTSLLTAAKSLEKEGQRVAPENNNAIEKYRSILKVDDRHEEAKSGIARIEQFLIGEVFAAIELKDKTLAIESLDNLRLFDTKHSKLTEFENQIIAIPEKNAIPDKTEATVPPTEEQSDAEPAIEETEGGDGVG
jgi:serine/threonine-protein kinase PpkA